MDSWAAAERFEDVVADAGEACADGAIFDLVLRHDLPLAAVHSNFVSNREEAAKEWMKTESEILHLTHGRYFKGEEGSSHVVEELRRKKLSRRALLSLISMNDLLGSGDEPLPSFMVLQFAMDQETLYATAYFRAMEVSSFLPVNLAEIALHCQAIEDAGLQSLERLKLMVVAFRAYADNNTAVHAVAELDRLSPVKVAGIVSREEIPRVRELLIGKRAHDSKIVLTGLQAMHEAASESPTGAYSKLFIAELAALIEVQRSIRKLKAQRSEGERIDAAWEKAKRHLDRALRELPE